MIPPGRRWRDAPLGLGLYYVTGVFVGIGLLFGDDIVGQDIGRRRELAARSLLPADLGELVENWTRLKGSYYLTIAQDGYCYDPRMQSSVAFFPAYPLLSRAVARLSGVRTEAALLIVSNVSLAATFWLLACYMRARKTGVSEGEIAWGLVVFGLWPTTFIFRMAYSESLFLVGELLTLYGMVRGWGLIPLALCAGLATATRPVGVAVAAAFLWYVACRPGKRAARLSQAIALAPLACWGLLAYMTYQYLAFGHPLAFVQTQEHWSFSMPEGEHPWWQKVLSLCTLEPIIGVYSPHSPRFWCIGQSNDNPLFNLRFWNPIFFLFSVGLVALGACRRWLTGPEVVLGTGLLAIPYFTRAYEMSMGSHGRFSAVVIANYLVLGKLAAAAPAPLAAVAVSMCAVVLTLWSALFAAGYF